MQALPAEGPPPPPPGEIPLEHESQLAQDEVSFHDRQSCQGQLVQCWALGTWQVPWNSQTRKRYLNV